MKKNSVLYFQILRYSNESLDHLKKKFIFLSAENPNAIATEHFYVDAIFAPLGYKFDKSYLDRFENLKVICSNTTSIPHIDKHYCDARGIKVLALHDQQNFLEKITPTAEFTILLILMLQRNIISAREDVLSNGTWNRKKFGGLKMLSRQTAGLIGMGRIGRKVASILEAFGTRVIHYDPYVPKGCRSLLELANVSDIVSIHAVSSSQTFNMIDEAFFNSMKSDSYFINTARSEIVDEAAMLRALKTRKIAGAAIDVFSGEFESDFDQQIKHKALFRYAKDNKNLIITPHIGGSTIDAWTETELHVIKRLEAELE